MKTLHTRIARLEHTHRARPPWLRSDWQRLPVTAQLHEVDRFIAALPDTAKEAEVDRYIATLSDLELETLLASLAAQAGAMS